MFIATLPRTNCHMKEDDICGSDYNCKPDHRIIKNSQKVTKTQKKPSIKNEKTVERGELDESFERLMMKKKDEKNLSEPASNFTMKETIMKKQENPKKKIMKN